MTPGKRSLAIKFPPKDSDTTPHQIEEKDGTKRLDPVATPAGLVANGSTSHGPHSLSSLSGKGEEFKGSKKRQSPCENFEPWSGVSKPVKKAPRTESNFISHSNSMIGRSPAGSSKNNHSAQSKPVYASGSRKNIYGTDSVDRGGNVLSSAAGGAPKQVKESKLKTDPTVKSLSAGMKELALHSKSETEGKSSSSSTASKSLSSNRTPASRTKSLQAGHSKFQITGTKVSGANSSPPFNAGRTTGTAGTKSVSSSGSKSHSAANRTGLKIHSTPSRSSSLGENSATSKQTVAATSLRGRGRGRGSGEESSRVSRQSSSSGSTVSKGRGRGGGITVNTTQHKHWERYKM